MKKKTLSLIALSIAISSLAQANQSSSSMHATQQTSTPMTDAQMTDHTITPAAGPKLKYAAEPFVTADYILWSAHEENLGFAYQTYRSAEAFNSLPKIHNSHIHHPVWRWGSGFKVGAGVNMKHDNWDAYANYTLFHPERAKRTINLVAPARTIIGLWTNPFVESAQNLTTQAMEQWHYKYDTLDVELGRKFYISKFLTLRPFAGLKTSWQDQRIIFDLVQDASILEQKMEQDFWGIGPRFGCDSTWYLWKRSFGIVADLAISGLWSQFNTKRSIISVPKTSNTDFVNGVQIRDDFHTLSPVIEWDFGFQWDSWFCKDRFHFGVRAAWEQQIWFSQNNFPQTTSGGSAFGTIAAGEVRGGNLVIQGITAGIRLDF
jgi:hypothetical protein